MNTLLFYLLLTLSVNATLNAFLEYNLGGAARYRSKFTCQRPSFFIKTADIEESKPANQDKIILYHGETYGAWIYQMFLKAFRYPEAPEDWLPLRFETLNTEIDKTTLLRLINRDRNDHHEEFTKIGLSVTPNLYSASAGESAWELICRSPFPNWDKLTGFSDNGWLEKYLYDQLLERFLPKESWSKFMLQKQLLIYFIKEKRKLSGSMMISDFKGKLKEYFPRTFEKYQDDFNALFRQEKSYYHYNEGVALQIIMEKEFADQITYYSKEYGWYKDEGKYSQSFKAWEEDDIQPYSEIYSKVKNQKDKEQARLALTNDFRRFPSRVRIKAIAGIMENTRDYEIVQSMIHEMVALRN